MFFKACLHIGILVMNVLDMPYQTSFVLVILLTHFTLMSIRCQIRIRHTPTCHIRFIMHRLTVPLQVRFLGVSRIAALDMSFILVFVSVLDV